MGSEILYCDRCSRQITPAEAKSFQALVTAGEAYCPQCVKELPPEKVSALRELTLGKDESSLNKRFKEPSKTRRTKRGVQPKKTVTSGGSGNAVIVVSATALIVAVMVVVLALPSGRPGGPSRGGKRSLATSRSTDIAEETGLWDDGTDASAAGGAATRRTPPRGGETRTAGPPVDEAPPAPLVAIAQVSTGETYLVSKAEAGAKYRIDRGYRLRRLPKPLDGQPLIVTRNDDDAVKGPEHLKLTLSRRATVHVCYAATASRIADWMKTFAPTGETVGTDDGRFEVYAKVCEPGEVWLGGNDRAATEASSNYFVVITPGARELVALKPPTGAGPSEKPEPAVVITTDAPLAVSATLAAKSTTPTLTDIAPYRETLVFYEYKIDRVIKGELEAKLVRVAHWGLRNAIRQPVTGMATGSRFEVLELVPLGEASDEVQQAREWDTLKPNNAVPCYFDLAQRIVKAPDSGSRFDYDCVLSEKMKTFFALQGQLRAVAIGDSRTNAGIDPVYLLGGTNRMFPEAYNLALNSAGIASTRLLVDEYLLNLPRLKWVAFGTSFRIFNAKWVDTKFERLEKSPGRAYDREHKEEIWTHRKSSGVRPEKDGKRTLWGFADFGAFTNDWRGKFWDPTVKERLRALVQEPNWEFDEARWKAFVEVVEKLDARGINLLCFTPPVHRFIADQPCTDEDGTPRAAYDDIVRRMKKLAGKYKRFHFVDVDNNGKNEFEDVDFANFDHLNATGAKRLTGILAAYIAKHGRSGRRGF